MQFTSIVGFSIEETPLTLDWAEEKFELFTQGILFKSFLIDQQMDCFLSWNMDDEGNEWWKLSIHHATFDIEYIEELEWICESFGVEQKRKFDAKKKEIK